MSQHTLPETESIPGLTVHSFILKEKGTFLPLTLVHSYTKSSGMSSSSSLTCYKYTYGTQEDVLGASAIEGVKNAICKLETSAG